jgi:Tfp pilus assembly protein PilX
MNMNTSKKQKGFVLVVVALLLVALIGFLAFAVDIGVLYSARTSAQEVADAAALAGAFTFINDTQSPQPQTASSNALQVALNNSVLGQPVAAADVNVNVDVANRRVAVDVQSTQNTYFARALGVQTANVGVEAVAEASKYATGSPCTKPWFIPNTAFSTRDACPACGANDVLISGGEVTAFAHSKFGHKFSVRSQAPSNRLAPGQFYAIDLTKGGGSDYRDNIANCADAYVRCLDSYSVLTGNKAGPTQQGVNDLVGNPPTDTWGSVGQYQTPNGLSDTSKAVVIAPIWDTCGASGFCPAGNFPSGTKVTLQIIGFAAFFLDGIQGSDVVAHLTNVSSCSPSAGDPGGTGGTVLSIPLRLVRTQ